MDVLRVAVTSARNLRAADSDGSSDPYVVVSCAKSKFQTDKVRHTLNPVWHEAQGELLVPRTAADDRTVLRVEVFDWNRVKKAVPLGWAEIRLAALPPNVPTSLDLPLVDGGEGSVQLTVNYLYTSVDDVIATSSRVGSRAVAPAASDTAAPVPPLNLQARPSESALTGISASPQLPSFYVSDARDAGAVRDTLTGAPDVLKEAAVLFGGELDLTIGSCSAVQLGAVSHARIKVAATAGGVTHASRSHHVHAHSNDVHIGEKLSFSAVPSTSVVTLTVLWSSRADPTSHVLGVATFPISELRGRAMRALELPLRGPEAHEVPPGYVHLQARFLEDGAVAGLTRTETGHVVITAGRVLEVLVVQGRKLKSFDSNGFSDPYVELSLAGLTVKTSVKKKTLNPVWAEAFSFPIPAEVAGAAARAANDCLIVTLWDWDRARKNDLMGRIAVPLSLVPSEGVLDREFAISDDAQANGVLRLKLSFKTNLVTASDPAAGPSRPLTTVAGSPVAGSPAAGLAPAASAAATAAAAAAAAAAASRDGGVCEEDDDSSLRFDSDEADASRAQDSAAAAGSAADASSAADAGGRTRRYAHSLTVRVVQAQHLVKMDRFGKSDPFVTLRLSEPGVDNVDRSQAPAFKSKIQKKTLEPKWNESHTFGPFVSNVPVMARDRTLLVEMFDWDFGASDEYMGEVLVPLAELPVTAAGIESVHWFALANAKHGDIQLGFTFVTTEQTGSAAPRLARHAAGSISNLAAANDIGRLTVHLVSAAQLVPMDSSGKSDPFVVFGVGEQQAKSRVIKKTLQPNWDQNFDFDEVRRSERLVCSVFDWNRLGAPVPMGEAVLPLIDLENNRTQKFVLPLTRPSSVEPAGEVELRVCFSSRTAALEQAFASLAARTDGSGGGWEVHVSLVEAVELVAKEANGLCDPFVVVRLGAQTWESPTLKYTTAPKWHADVTFRTGDVTHERLVFEVYDWTRRSSSTLIGVVDTPLAGLGDDVQEDLWLRLKRVESGKLHVRITKKNSAAEARRMQDVVAARAAASAARAAYAQGGEGAAAVLDVRAELAVTVIEARDLLPVNAGGDADPYVVLTCGVQTALTQLRLNTLAPKWDQSFTFAGVTDADVVEFAVFDWERLGPDRPIGTVNMPVRSVPLKRPFRAWLSLRGVETGEILVEFYYDFVATVDGRRVAAGSDEAAAARSAEAVAQSELSNSVPDTDRLVSVRVIEARNLQQMRAMDTTDLYCVLACGLERLRTHVRQRTMTPVWDERFELHYSLEPMGEDKSAASASADTLSLTVYDMNTGVADTNMGTVSIRLPDLEENRLHALWLPLDNARAGEVHVEVCVTRARALPPLEAGGRMRSLYVQLVEASGLGGAEDVYAVLAVGQSLQTSSTVRTTTDSQPLAWGEAFRFRSAASDVLRVQVHEWKHHYAGRLLASTVVPLAGMTQDGHDHDVWLALLGGPPGAKVHLRLTLNPLVLLDSLGADDSLALPPPAEGAPREGAAQQRRAASVRFAVMSLVVVLVAMALMRWWTRRE